MIGLDTSVVLRLLVGEPAGQADVARAFLDTRAEVGDEPACISDLVVGETYFALRHHYGVPHGEAVAALRLLLLDSRIRATGVAGRILGRPDAETSEPGLMDRLIHGDYDERDSAVLVTFDRVASRLPGAEHLEF